MNHPNRPKLLSLPPATQSCYLLITLAPASVGRFRFLLEANDNLALFKVLDTRIALLKLMYSVHQAKDIQAMLEVIAAEIDFFTFAWPWLPTETLGKRA